VARRSDRWVTPGVVVVVVIVAGVLVLATIAAVTYLTARGVDPDPMLRLVAQAVTAVGSLVTAGVTVAGRAGVAKVERQVGILAPRVADTLDELDAARDAHLEAAAVVGPRHAYPDTAVRPVERPPVPGRGAAPAPVGS
jgi:hypothetical protein